MEPPLRTDLREVAQAAPATARRQMVSGWCVTNTFLKEEVWSCTRDEGGPLEASGQARASNPCKLRSSRAMVVSVAAKGGTQIPSGAIRRGERKRTADEVSKCQRRCQNRGVVQLPGSVRERSWRLPERHPACRRREAGSGSCMERENLSPRCEGRRPSGENRKDQSTNAGHRGGAARSRVEGSVMGLDRRGCIVQLRPRANR